MRILIVGPSGAGKTTLINALVGKQEKPRKTQALDFIGGFVDTPGEYSEIPRFYTNLFISAQQADLVFLVLAADMVLEQIPQGWSQALQKPVIGIVSKVDLERADIGKVSCFLSHAGVQPPYYPISVLNGEGLKELQLAINKLCCE